MNSHVHEHTHNGDRPKTPAALPPGPDPGNHYLISALRGLPFPYCHINGVSLQPFESGCFHLRFFVENKRQKAAFHCTAYYTDTTQGSTLHEKRQESGFKIKVINEIKTLTTVTRGNILTIVLSYLIECI